MSNRANVGLQPKFGACLGHFGLQHGDDVFCAIIAKQLAQRFFVPRDAIAADQFDKIPLGITGEGGFVEMRVFAKVIGGCDIKVGKVAPTTARNADLFARSFGVIDDQDLATAAPCAKQASRASPKYQRIHLHRPEVTPSTPLRKGKSPPIAVQMDSVPAFFLVNLPHNGYDFQ